MEEQLYEASFVKVQGGKKRVKDVLQVSRLNDSEREGSLVLFKSSP